MRKEIETKAEALLPKDELKQWVESHYGNSTPELTGELKAADFKAIEEENLDVLKKLADKMDIQRTYLRGKFPEEWKTLDNLYQKLLIWLSKN